MTNPERRAKLALNSFRELFSGRFDEQEAGFLLQLHDGDAKAAASFVLTSEPSAVRLAIEQERESWTAVLPHAKREKVISTIENFRQQPQSQVLARAMSGRIETPSRLFACAPCDNFWWRRTPERKPVSKCKTCHKRYDAVPRDREWGWAEFTCQDCGHEFSGYCGMWMESPCYNCQRPVLPTLIKPPKPRDNQRHQSRNTHRCMAPDCQCNAPRGRGGVTGEYAGAVFYGHVAGRGGPGSWMPRRGRGGVSYATIVNAGGVTGGNLRDLDPGSEYDYDVTESEEPVRVQGPTSGHSANGAEQLPRTCVHPQSRRAQNLSVVIVPSRLHDSTGSTVDTFLPQDDPNCLFETIPMVTINEDVSDSDE